ncbi:hypothetical protein KM043_007463 [Ampulex compressa]|nr:hypothetical protein KM043_007463 [Ampulex compressa]
MRWGGGTCDILRRKFFVLLVLVGCSDGYLNIFISRSQVMKLLGLEAELYYVREGAVNTYAMNFVVPVPANIADLEFSWQSLAGHPAKGLRRELQEARARGGGRVKLPVAINEAQQCGTK